MEIYDGDGKKLKIGGIYLDDDRKVPGNGGEVCKVTFVEKYGFGVFYSGGFRDEFSEGNYSREEILERATKLKSATLKEIFKRAKEYRARANCLQEMVDESEATKSNNGS